MSLSYQVLGGAGLDNALLVQVDSGQAVERLLFDCGEACLTSLSHGEIFSLDHLFFSHLHMDHVAGFDAFFRANYSRVQKPNHIWGPPGTSRILAHRFQGYLWNLAQEMYASWLVHDVAPSGVASFRYELNEAFSSAHAAGEAPVTAPLTEGVGYTVETRTLEHRTPVLAYLVREKPRLNVAMDRLAHYSLKPGPWLKQVKDLEYAEPTVQINEQAHDIAALRRDLLVKTPGDSVAYLSDFLLDEAAMETLVPWLAGASTVVCESQYCHADLELALRNYHMTSVQAATLAQRANVGQLVLFHLADRYRPEQWQQLLAEAQAIFPRTSFPGAWGLA